MGLVILLCQAARLGIAGKEAAYDVLTEHKVDRPIFTDPKTWEKSVAVTTNGSSTVNFVIGNK